MYLMYSNDREKIESHALIDGAYCMNAMRSRVGLAIFSFSRFFSRSAESSDFFFLRFVSLKESDGATAFTSFLFRRGLFCTWPHTHRTWSVRFLGAFLPTFAVRLSFFGVFEY